MYITFNYMMKSKTLQVLEQDCSYVNLTEKYGYLLISLFSADMDSSISPVTVLKCGCKVISSFALNDNHYEVLP